MLSTNVDHQDHPTLLAQYLADADVPCPACGYNLRGLTAGVCPECNQRLRLSISLHESCTGQLIAALFGLVTCSGAAGLLLALVAAISFPNGGWPSSGNEFILLIEVPAIALAVAGLPAGFLARRGGRLWFARRSVQLRYMIIAASWAVPGVFLVYYVSKIAN